MEFYSVKHRRTVEVPDEAISGRVITRETANGTQTRYLLVGTAEVEGATVTMTRFVTRDDYDAHGGSDGG